MRNRVVILAGQIALSILFGFSLSAQADVVEYSSGGYYAVLGADKNTFYTVLANRLSSQQNARSCTQDLSSNRGKTFDFELQCVHQWYFFNTGCSFRDANGDWRPIKGDDLTKMMAIWRTLEKTAGHNVDYSVSGTCQPKIMDPNYRDNVSRFTDSDTDAATKDLQCTFSINYTDGG